MSFGKVSQPVVTAAGKPFVSGVAPSGRSIAAAGPKPTVYAQPIVAWQPALGATSYELELSRGRYPWSTVTKISTPSTSLRLPLTRLDAGTWFYRVRGINSALPPSAQAMSWSKVVQIRITGNQFKVLK
jgi:hypothetical protein